MSAQVDIGIAYGRRVLVEITAEVLLQVLGILHRVHQLQGGQLAADPELLVRLVQRQVEAAHEAQQVAVHTLDMPLVERLRIQVVALRPRLQQALVGLDALQLIHRQVEGMADHLQAQPAEVAQLAHHGTGGRVHRIQRTLVEVARLGPRWRLRPGGQLGDQHLRLLALRQPAHQPLGEPRLQGPEQQHAHGVDQAVEHRQLDQLVVGQAGQPGDLPHQPGQRPEQDEGQGAGDDVEQHMGQRQALAAAVTAEGADEGSGDAAADIGADGNGQPLSQFQLATGERRQGQHQGGVAGLQHHGHQQAEQGEQQTAGQPVGLVRAEVEAVAEAGEALLDLVDTEEDEGDAEDDAPRRLALLPHEPTEHAEHQQRQRQGTQAEVLPGHGQQPDTAGGAQVGAEQDRDAAGQLDQAGTDESDGEQGNQGAGLQQQGAADTEHHPLEGGGGAARQQLFQLAAGQLAQALLQALHAEQEERKPRAELQPAGAEPEAGGQRGGGQGEQENAGVGLHGRYSFTRTRHQLLPDAMAVRQPAPS
ncbi:hypothetical protein D9M69_419010 [compost metagenome]